MPLLGMDTAALLRKLEPLVPEKVRHWHRVRDTADADIRALVDREIAHTAHQLLGNYRKKILLSLPARDVAKGTIHLGTAVYDQPKWPVGISDSELLQNLAIFGRSGAGKTNVAFHLLDQLVARKVPFLFLDWKRTARHLLPHLKHRVAVYTAGRSLAPMQFNPFIPPPGIESHIYLNLLIDVLAAAYTLGEGAKSVVQRAISACYQAKNWPTPQDVLSAVEAQEARNRAAGWQVSAQRALQSLVFSKVLEASPAGQEDLIQSLAEGSTIIELDGLDESTKRFLVPMLCLWLYRIKLASGVRERLTFVIFVEEAHHVLYRQEHRAKESVMNMLLRQCREIGIGMVVIDQHPHLISSAALGNTYTGICLNLKDPSDISRAAGLSLVDDTEKHSFSMLPVGQAIVKLQDRWRRPFLVQFPLVDVAKGAVTDERLSALLSGSLTGSALKRRVAGESKGIPRILGRDSVLEEDGLRLMEDVLEHPEDGVRVRYARLGMSTRRGHALKEQLVRQGWLEQALIETGQTRKLLLRLSSEARNALGMNTAAGRGSLAHEYWKQHYAHKFEEQGYIVVLEYPRVGGQVDVYASKEAERVGIEVETGKSDVVGNVKNCLLSNFDRALVVATDEAAMAKVERQLGKAGLLIPGRVKVVLRAACEGVERLHEQPGRAEALIGWDAQGEAATPFDSDSDERGVDQGLENLDRRR